MFVVGIDIGKEELAASLQCSPPGELPQVLDSVQTVTNAPAGLNKLTRWLEKHLEKRGVSLVSVHVVMEATNLYWEACAHHFYDVGCTISVVNPAQMKFFAKSTLRRGKTDAMDAEIIARFGLMMRPARWMPPTQTWTEIKQLVREREAVQKPWTKAMEE